MVPRSSQRQTSRKHYTLDPFEGVDALQDAQDGPEPSYMPVHRRQSDGDSADDFDIEAEPPVDENEDRMELAGNASEVNSPQGEHQLDEDLDELDARPTSSREHKRKHSDDPDRLYTNPMPEGLKASTAKSARALFYFGPSHAELDPVNDARHQWTYEATLPSRQTDENGFGGYHESYFFTEDERKARAEEAWRWYRREGGKPLFEESQRVTPIEVEESKEYLPTDDAATRTVLMGPHKEPRFSSLAPRTAMPLPDAWRTYNSHDGTPYPLRKGYKAGFLLNLGAKIQSIDWAPNQNGLDQYLAVSVLPPRGNENESGRAPGAPAFTPQPAYKSSIQIWRFNATEDYYVDTDTIPALKTLLCTSWGDVKALKWCPVPFPAADDGENSGLGLLAGLWSDGAVRILSISKPSSTDDTETHLVTHAAFEARPPNTVCTTLTWITPTRMAAGCANGYLAVWDLPSIPPPGDPTHPSNPRPKIYIPIAPTYILALTSLQPSRPNFIAATSQSGILTLTDLSSPHPSSPASTIPSRRQRLGQSLLAWNDFSQCLLSAEDTLYQKAWPLRRVFATVTIGKYSSLPTVFATSPVHPFLLSGTAGGEVLVNNPMRRVADGRAGLWVQTWFAHEWRRGKANTNEESGSENGHGSASNATSNTSFGSSEEGLTKITEGFSVTKIDLRTEVDETPAMKDIKVRRYKKKAKPAVPENPDIPNSNNQTNDPNTPAIATASPKSRIGNKNTANNTSAKTRTPYNGTSNVAVTTVHESRTAVTALAWNPNLKVGGWAAAGLADGLLRVEDLGT
ncbi:hypothetical protein MBLNU230_g8221t1 [Neophaeotheca triangularis]